MTIIAAYIAGQTVHFASDSLFSGEGPVGNSGPKFFYVFESDFGHVAAAGMMSILQTVYRHRAEMFEEVPKGLSPYDVGVLVTARLRKLALREMDTDKINGATMISGTLMFSYGASIIQIFSDFSFSIMTGEAPYEGRFCAIGSGKEFAVGAYYALVHPENPPWTGSPKEILRTCISAAIENDEHCGGLIRYSSLKDGVPSDYNSIGPIR